MARKPALGFWQAPAVRQALAIVGIQTAGIRWLWIAGRKGGVYPPHVARNNIVVFNPEGFVGEPEHGCIPGDGLTPNARYCQCAYRLVLRGAGGRFLPEERIRRQNRRG